MDFTKIAEMALAVSVGMGAAEFLFRLIDSRRGKSKAKSVQELRKK